MNNDVNPELSIIVACRNERSHIGRFFDSLASQDLAGIRWEAIIADGMSEDGTREIIFERCSGDSCLRAIENPGRIVSTGLNAAIRAARGDVILRMDAHSRYASDYCRQCVETLKRTGAANVGGPARTDAASPRERAIAAAFHSGFSTGGAKFHDETYEGWVDTVTFGCWRKATLDAIGLFDPELVRNQDDELNLRLRRAGGTIWQSPAIACWYSPRAKLANLFWQYFQYGFWRVAVLRKHRAFSSWRQLVPAAFVLSLMILLVGTLIAALYGSTELLLISGGAGATFASAYAIASLVASTASARIHGWDILPLLPPVFAVYHFSYGLGFLAGLVRQLTPSRPPFDRENSVFVRLTR